MKGTSNAIIVVLALFAISEIVMFVLGMPGFYKLIPIVVCGGMVFFTIIFGFAVRGVMEEDKKRKKKEKQE